MISTLARNGMRMECLVMFRADLMDAHMIDCETVEGLEIKQWLRWSWEEALNSNVAALLRKMVFGRLIKKKGLKGSFADAGSSAKVALTKGWKVDISAFGKARELGSGSCQSTGAFCF
ncbi:Hypothetical predicted protein [Olea europaea subsp. europaea]|uniref:Uncharacterized protein n=1 Tax=Olea europaea subsp. europaea TaxID=158383 RepID=A0A8S0QVX0_OLEEU|nr:Hypothetical predicted protein [Olea europaea subsp. europaea]